MRKSLHAQKSNGAANALAAALEEAPGAAVGVADDVETGEMVKFICTADLSPEDFAPKNDAGAIGDDEACAGTWPGGFAEEDMLYEPGVKVPHSGIYVMVNPTGEVTDTERTAVKGEPFPPTAKKGQAYRLVRAAHNAAGSV